MAAASLLTMPPVPTVEPAPPAMASISGVIASTVARWRAVGIAARVGGVEAVDVGEEDQGLGRGHHGDPGREPVIVAEADLARGHGVVLVDDRDHAQAQQGLQRGAGVEIAAAGLGVVQRDQHLADAQAAAAEALLIGVGEDDLAHRGRRLLLLQPVRAPLEAERATAQCDRARGDDDHLLAAGGEHGDVGGKAVEPGLAYAPFLVDQQRAADLDDDPARAQRLGSTAHQAASSRRAGGAPAQGPRRR